YRAIGRALGVSEAQAHRDVAGRMKHLAKIEDEKAETVRRFELERLDACVRGLQRGVEAGDPRAINASIRVTECRVKLLGLDAPPQTQPTGKDSGNDNEPTKIETELDFNQLDDEQLNQLDRLVALAARSRRDPTRD